MNQTEADNLIGTHFDSLPVDTDEHRDLDLALHQSARLWEGRADTFDQRMKPLALLDSVDRLRHWQEHSTAPAQVRNAMGTLAQQIRARAGRVYDIDLLNEIDRLRAKLHGRS